MIQQVQEVQGVQELLELQDVQTHHGLPEVKRKIAKMMYWNCFMMLTVYTHMQNLWHYKNKYKLKDTAEKTL